jgi:hypothetical protein
MEYLLQEVDMIHEIWSNPVFTITWLCLSVLTFSVICVWLFRHIWRLERYVDALERELDAADQTIARLEIHAKISDN